MELNKVVHVPLKAVSTILCDNNFLDSLSLDIIWESGRWSVKSGDWEGANNEHVVNQSPPVTS